MKIKEMKPMSVFQDGHLFMGKMNAFDEDILVVCIGSHVIPSDYCTGHKYAYSGEEEFEVVSMLGIKQKA